MPSNGTTVTDVSRSMAPAMALIRSMSNPVHLPSISISNGSYGASEQMVRVPSVLRV